MLKKIITTCLIVFTLQSLTAQVNFNRGVNLSNWFQTNGARQIQFTKFTRQDFVNIKSLGCDVVRLPINLHSMTNGTPDYTIDPLFFEFLDKVVDWAEELQINLILDNHTFDPVENTDPNIGPILVKVWKQMATHYKNRTEYVLYEILNEPHGLTTLQWGQIQKTVIDAIRTIDTKHTLIVGGSGYNSINELKNLPVYTDSKLIYTFHFYDPFMFTHQGATWGSPSMASLKGVPFPYDAAKMPVCPPDLKGTWVEGSLNDYQNNGTVAKVKSTLDIAVNFKNSRNVKVFCGEFGVYIPNSDNTQRVFWYDVVRKYLEEKGISWTTWDYTGGFGLFNKDSDEMFDYDLNINLVQALGFNVPAQKTFVIRPDSVGFPMYSDIIEKNILGSGSAITDFYNANRPNNGKYSLYWVDAARYNNIGFDFKPNKDLSKLVSEGYALDMIIRGNATDAKFDVRFIDTKTGSTDHPWRMKVTIDNTYGPWDKYWHHIHIPLSRFTEQGSWDNNTWYNPEGKFDWKAVDRMEIVSEHEALTGKPFWFDNITITNKDTAIVRETNILSSTKYLGGGNSGKVSVYPNPMNDNLNIIYSLDRISNTNFEVYTLSGSKVYSSDQKRYTAGSNSIQWNGRDQAGYELPNGMYLIKVAIDQNIETYKLSINRN